jgi:hypothetical protein
MLDLEPKFENNPWRSITYGQNLDNKVVSSQPKCHPGTLNPQGFFRLESVDVND